MTTIARIPARAKRTQKIGAAPDARTPMLLELGARIEKLAILERLASTPAYLALANIAHGINSYTETASVNAEYSEPALTFYLYQSNLQRWSDPKYAQAINDIQFAIAKHEPERKDTENKDNLHRAHVWTWSFETGNPFYPEALIKVQLDAYESKDTAECRRVQVGTKTIEEPIYRYDCVAPEGNAGELPAPTPVIDANII
jgi:hypothetical protein